MASFVFIVHSRDIDDFIQKYWFSKVLPPRILEHCLRYISPVIVSEITGLSSKTGKEASGWLIGIPMTAKQMLRDRKLAQRRIFQTVSLAEKYGAKIVGLGSLTSPLSNQGLDLVGKFNLGITTGNSYTVGIIWEDVLKFSRLADIELNKSRLAIIGATGAIGSGCAKLFHNLVSRLILIDRSQSSLEELTSALIYPSNLTEIITSTRIGNIAEADIVILTTTAIGTLVHPKDLSSGTIVYDITQPSNLSRNIVRDKDDILVIQGGNVFTAGIDYDFNFGLPEETAFGCLAETMLLALEDWDKDYSLGKVKLSQVEQMREMAKKHGFYPAPFQCFGKPVKAEDIQRIKEYRQKSS